MGKLAMLRVPLAYLLIPLLAVMLYSPAMITGQANPLSGQLTDPTQFIEEEFRVLQDLFTLVQEIEEMEREEENITQEITPLKDSITRLEMAIAREEEALQKNQGALEEVLKSYQRMGAGSYLEIILASDSLGAFLRRLNTLRDLTRNTGLLLDALDLNLNQLSQDKATLTGTLGLLKEKQIQLQQALARALQKRDELEAYLVTLAEQRTYYESHLANVQQAWNELKPLFSHVKSEFSRIIEAGNLPLDAMQITIFLFSIRGVIEEDTFNQVVARHDQLPEMVFSFTPDKAQLRLPQHQLTLAGDFVVVDRTAIKYVVKEGTFYGLPLEKASLDELFRGGDLRLDFAPVLEGNTLNSIEVREGALELRIRFSLF